MKAISVKEDNLDSPLEECFGKAKYFCFIKDNSDNIEFALNPGYDLLKNSGKIAVEYLLERKVETIISRNYGIAVKKMFNKHKIQTVIISSKYEILSQLLSIIK